MIPILYIVVKAAATFFFLSVLFMASGPPWWSAFIHNVTDRRVAAVAHNMIGRAHSVGHWEKEGLSFVAFVFF